MFSLWKQGVVIFRVSGFNKFDDSIGLLDCLLGSDRVSLWVLKILGREDTELELLRAFGSPDDGTRDGDLRCLLRMGLRYGLQFSRVFMLSNGFADDT